MDPLRVEAMRTTIRELREENARLRELLADFDWDETGTPTGWPNRDRVDAALRGPEEGK